ncbi:MAG: hypothetical protein JXR40_01085 [Pontiellaceae bacterium]|nr:hypothetical protein [Pontiellaceae bacterium]
MRLQRVIFVILWALSAISSSFADYMMLEGDGNDERMTTGEQFEGVADEWATHPVLEINDLLMSARTTNATHKLNANNGEFGINSDIVGENSEAFDVGEVMKLYFNRDVELNVLDFNRFDSGDCFVLYIEGSSPLEIEYGDLSNGTSDTYTFAEPLHIAADTTISFYVRSDSGSVGMDGIDLQAIPEPMAAGLISITGIGLLLVRRFFAV